MHFKGSPSAIGFDDSPRVFIGIIACRRGRVENRTDQWLIAAGQYRAVLIGDSYIKHIRQVCRFFKQCLDLLPAPHHSHHTGSGPGFHTLDQRRSFFFEDAGHIVLFPIVVLHGHDNNDDHQNQR